MIRPDLPSPTESPFVDTASGWDRHLEPDAVYHVVTAHAADAGWYRAGDDREGNVAPHYFRHSFIIHLRDRTSDRSIVKYLRGGTVGDIIDTCTHNWDDRVREAYESNIYSLR